MLTIRRVKPTLALALCLCYELKPIRTFAYESMLTNLCQCEPVALRTSVYELFSATNILHYYTEYYYNNYYIITQNLIRYELFHYEL